MCRLAEPRADVRATIDSDVIERVAKERMVILSGSVVARLLYSRQYADRMDVYLKDDSDHILRTVSIGHVRIITTDCSVGSAEGVRGGAPTPWGAVEIAARAAVGQDAVGGPP